MKKLLVPLVLVLISGCSHYSQNDGEKLEAFARAQSEWNEYMQDHHYFVEDSGINPAYVQKLRNSILKLCEQTGIDPDQCEKEFDPGPGDTADNPPKGQPPKWGG